MRFTKKTAALGVFAILGVLFVGAGIAYAIPTSTIRGCYQNDPFSIVHQLYVLDDNPESCPAGYSPLNWSLGLSGYEVVSQSLTVVGPVGAGQIVREIDCPGGKVALGGSGISDVVASQPKLDGTGWEFTINHPSVGAGETYQSTNRITCATVGS